MKTSNFLVLSIFFISIFISCTTEDEIMIDSETKSLKKFTEQFYNVDDTDFKVLSVDDKPNDLLLSKIKSTSSNINSFNMEVHHDIKGNISISAINYNLNKSNENITTTIVDYEDELGGNVTYEFVLEKINDDQYKIIEYNNLTSGLSKSLDENGNCDYSGADSYGECFSTCMGCVMDTDGAAGQVITVLGIAGGMGCGPCGIAGGVIFGFAALGCAGC